MSSPWPSFETLRASPFALRMRFGEAEDEPRMCTMPSARLIDANAGR
jgi:hypothetical protein